MERKTKEQLLGPKRYPVMLWTTREATAAMQAYANQEIAAFTEWLWKSSYHPHGTGWVDTRSIKTESGGVYINLTPLTTQQLIGKYKNEH